MHYVYMGDFPRHIVAHLYIAYDAPRRIFILGQWIGSLVT